MPTIPVGRVDVRLTHTMCRQGERLFSGTAGDDMEKDERETTRVCNHDRCGQFCPVCGEDLTAIEPWRRDLLAHLAAVRKSNRER